MTKILGIYFSSPGILDYPLSNKNCYESYAEIIEHLEKKGIKTVIVRNKSYLGKGEFSHYFIWDSNKYKKVDKKIKIDLLWNRDSENVIPKIDDLEILNNFEFDEICRDKIKSYELFKDISGKTILINSYEDLINNLSKINSERIILKPRYGEGCYGVYAINKDEINPRLYEDWSNILLQEFLDSSGGIKGLVEGLHEINVYIVNGEFAGARLKQPPTGKFISSAMGKVVGTVRGIKKDDIPEDLFKVIEQINSKIKKFPIYLYRADFVYTTAGEFKMIEINSRPGVTHPNFEGKDFYWDFNGKIIDVISSYLK